MKKIISAGLLCFSITGLAGTEFFSKFGNEECSIVGDQVKKTVTFHKGKAGYTQTTKIQTFGIEALVSKALETATGRTNGLGLVFEVKVNGKVTSIDADDSPESRALIQFINAACFK